MIRLILVLSVLALGGCAAATPLLIAEGAGHEIARRDENIKVRGAAALAEEADLLTFSVQAIARGKTDKAVATFLKGYADPDYSSNIKSLAIYQIGLIYMNRYNDFRNDDKARAYFNQHRIEFPESRLKQRVLKRLKVLEERNNEAVQLSATQLLKQVNRAKLLARDDTPFDAELTPMSERAITDERVEDAEGVYLILYDNKASSNEMRAKALYQLGLIYMSPYNRHGDNRKALAYFRKIATEFPQTTVAKRANHKATVLINRQY